MTTAINFSSIEQCILVRHEGEVTEAEIRKSMDDIFEVATESGARRLLIDWRSASSIPSCGELWYVMQARVGQVGLRRDLKRAIVARTDQRWTADLFAELAKNHGFLFRVFGEQSDALGWLTESIATPSRSPEQMNEQEIKRA